MSGVVDGPGTFRWLEGAIEAGEVLGLDGGRAFNGAGGVDVANDGVDLVVGIAELEERGGHGVIDDLDHAAADQLLVLDESEIGFDAGGIAIHHEADGAGRREDGDLRIAVAMLLAMGESLVPAIAEASMSSLSWGVTNGSALVRDLPMLLTSARCMRMTSRKGSRLT